MNLNIIRKLKNTYQALMEYEYIIHIESPEYIEHFKPICDNLDKEKTIILSEFDHHETIYGVKLYQLSKFEISLVYKFSRAKFLFTSTPGLNVHHLKKSQQTQYIYIHHSLISTHYGYRENDFINFDYILCFSDIHIDESNLISKYYKKNIKALPIEFFKLSLAIKEDKETMKNTALIAPTWGKKSLLYSKDLLLHIKKLEEVGIKTAIAPHPFSFKVDSEKISELESNGVLIKKGGAIHNDLNTYEYLITDTSGIGIEYSIITNRKPLVLTDYKKCRNKNYPLINSQVIEVTMINKYGYPISENDLLKTNVKDIDLNETPEIRSNIYLDKSINQKTIDFIIGKSPF